MNDSPQQNPKPQPRSMLRVFPFLAILAVAIFVYVKWGDLITFELLRDKRNELIAFRDANYVFAVASFIAIYAIMVLFSVPGATIASLTGGFMFGILSGTVFNVLAATLGATGIFLAVRWGFGERFSQKLDASEGRIKQLKDGIDENQWSMLFLIRLLPIVPFVVANLVPAIVGVKLWRFVVSTFVGIIPGTFVITSVGAGLSDVFTAGETPDLGIIFSPGILFPLLGLSALALLPVIYKSIRARSQKLEETNV